MKKFIRKIFGIEQIIQENQQLKKDNENLRKDLKVIMLNQMKNQETLSMIQSVLNVGIDVHTRSNSWAVICIDGKPDYIKFVDLGKTEIKEIGNFLKHFSKDNTIIDMPQFCISKNDLFKFHVPLV